MLSCNFDMNLFGSLLVELQAFIFSLNCLLIPPCIKNLRKKKKKNLIQNMDK